MIVVTIDPLTYVKLVALMIIAVIVGALIKVLVPALVFRIRWTLTKPPAQVSESDIVRLASGDEAIVHFVYPGGLISVYSPPYGDMQRSDVVKIGEVRLWR